MDDGAGDAVGALVVPPVELDEPHAASSAPPTSSAPTPHAARTHLEPTTVTGIDTPALGSGYQDQCPLNAPAALPDFAGIARYPTS